MTTRADALAWAIKMRFCCFTSMETIKEAYAAHLRIMEKAKRRKQA